MSQERSDALVFFGATGDLAHKKIFPALQAMAKHRDLDIRRTRPSSNCAGAWLAPSVRHPISPFRLPCSRPSFGSSVTRDVRRARASSSRSLLDITWPRPARVLHGTVSEENVFRLDHYLGKNTVQNLLYFRFANSFLEPLWNRQYEPRRELTARSNRLHLVAIPLLDATTDPRHKS